MYGEYAANNMHPVGTWDAGPIVYSSSFLPSKTEVPDVARRYPPSSNRVNRQPSPRMFIKNLTQAQYDRAVTSMKKYCIAYSLSAESRGHMEPPVHRETKHAIFAQQMQDGLAFRNVDMSKAFGKIREAFVTLEYSINHPCPMNLALIMSVICNLEKEHAQHIHAGFLRQSRTLAHRYSNSHPWIPMFDALARYSDMATDMSLRCMRIARDELKNQLGRSDWKTLYVEERLCDCLYYVHIDGERMETRRALYEAQTILYGPFARNVL